MRTSQGQWISRKGRTLGVLCGGAVVAAVLTLSSMIVVEAAKPPKPQPTAVTATFRCVDDGTLCPAAVVDRIKGDTSGPYAGFPATQLGALINTFGDFSLNLQPSMGRYLHLDFGAPVSSPPCGNGCRRAGAFVFAAAAVSYTPFGAGTNVVDANGVELANGIRSIPVGELRPARVLINFADPYGRNLIWTVRFNPTHYPGSSHVSVTRTALKSWTIEAAPGDLAKLVASPSGGVQKQTDEGLFSMPFRITVIEP